MFIRTWLNSYSLFLISVVKILRPRAAFTVADGAVLVSADFCQLELRVLAHLSQDPILLRLLSTSYEDGSQPKEHDAFKLVSLLTCNGLIYQLLLNSPSI